MSVDYGAGLAVLREEVERQLVDTCRIVRPGGTGQTPQLDAEGNVPEPNAATLYEGPCLVGDPANALLSGRTTDDESGVPNTRVGKLPVGSPSLQPGDLWLMLASRYSPGLVGDQFEVLGEEERSFATHRRYQLRGSSWVPPVETSAAPAN